MKVKYSFYSCSVGCIHWFGYQILNLKLLWRRGCRNAKNVLKMFSPVLSLLPVWAIFLFALDLLSQSYSFMDYLQQAKFSIFTSIILAGANNISVGMKKRHRNFLEQHILYTDLMVISDSLVQIFYRGIYPPRKCQLSWPFYTKKRAQKTMNIFEESTEIKFEDKGELLSMIESLSKHLEKIESSCKAGDFCFSCNSTCIIDTVESCIEVIHDIKTAICNNDEFSFDTTKLLRNLSGIIECLRFPWRRDEDINKKRRKIIYKYSTAEMCYIELLDDNTIEKSVKNSGPVQVRCVF